VGCNYSVPGHNLQVRDSGVGPAWPTGMSRSGRLLGAPWQLRKPSLSGKHSTFDRSAAPTPLKGGQAQTGQGSVVVDPAPFERGRTRWSQAVTQ